MKGIIVNNESDRPQLHWRDVPNVEYAVDEVLVNIKATAVNRADLLQAGGNYPPPAGASPLLGLEMAGEIAAIGADVTGWQVGDRVCALLPGGGYAEQINVPAGMLMRIPEGWSFETGAAVPEVWLTAFVNLFLEGSLQPGETALIHAAASGVGTAAIQLAKASGFALVSMIVIIITVLVATSTVILIILIFASLLFLVLFTLALFLFFAFAVF